MTTLSTARRSPLVSRVSLGLVILVLAACGESTDTSTTTIDPPTTAATQPTTVAPDTSAPATTAPDESTTTAPTTLPPETTAPPAAFAVASHGAGAVDPLPGSDGMLGSGCTPGGDALRDGIWFGWIEAVRSGGFTFDLACLEAGSPATATNSNPRTRDIKTAEGMPVQQLDPGPVWIYVNGGMATEIANPTITFTIDEGTSAWTEASVSLPIGGGCCGEMYSGTPSPDEPWPASGLPADGYYGLDVTVDSAADALILRIMKFVPCADRPEICNEDYFEGDLALDWDDPLFRTVPLDGNLTVQLMGIHIDKAVHPNAVLAVEGSGSAFSGLLEDNAAAFNAWIQPEIDAGTDYEDIRDLLIAEAAADPNFPYAVSKCCDADWSPMVYVGPLGVELVEWLYEPNNFLGPSQLEIRNGQPILIMDGGRIAG